MIKVTESQGRRNSLIDEPHDRRIDISEGDWTFAFLFVKHSAECRDLPPVDDAFGLELCRIGAEIEVGSPYSFQRGALSLSLTRLPPSGLEAVTENPPDTKFILKSLS